MAIAPKEFACGNPNGTGRGVRDFQRIGAEPKELSFPSCVVRDDRRSGNWRRDAVKLPDLLIKSRHPNASIAIAS